LGNAADFIINTGGELLNGLITFAQKGQEAHDKTRGFIKNLGGENFAKGFDKFIGAIDTALFLTTVLAGSMAMEAMSGGGGGGPGGPDPRRQPTRTTSGGRTLDTPNIRNPLRQNQLLLQVVPHRDQWVVDLELRVMFLVEVSLNYQVEVALDQVE
jgi:hypothetical protein